ERGQRLLAAGEQRQRRRLLAGRPRDDLETTFERVLLALDHFEPCLAAAEQRAEQALEVTVHLIEGLAEALLRLAIELTDGATQLMDCLLDVEPFQIHARELLVELL